MGIVRASKLVPILLVFLLVSSSFLSTPAESHASPAPGSVDWITMNSNANATNYVAQSQVVASTAQNLQVAWTFPFPSAPSVPGLAIPGEGSISPPLVVNGTVYLVDRGNAALKYFDVCDCSFKPLPCFVAQGPAGRPTTA